MELKNEYTNNQNIEIPDPNLNYIRNLYSSAFSTINSCNAVANVYTTQSDVFLAQGSLYNDFLLYQQSIEILTHSIQLNPTNRDAYIERAMAYFETNQLALALQDYESAKKLTIIPPLKPYDKKTTTMLRIPDYVPENSADFSAGLVFGMIDGAKISTQEFLPSIFSSCRGILSGLWVFACSPIEVSQEMINAAYAVGEYINTHSAEECFQHVVPELKEISIFWKRLDDRARGEKIGYIIGKYGVDIFAPIGIIKAVNKIRALKRANTMLTLETCTASQIKQIRILERSNKYASLRAKVIVDAMNKKSILINSPNAIYHIMQPKHAWDKVLQLTGNVEKDFKNLVVLLEEKAVLSEKYFISAEEFMEGKIMRSEYRAVINNHAVKAIFEAYTETGQTFLKDAWVITK